MKFNRNYLFFPALLTGILILVLAIKLRPTVPAKSVQDRSKPVDVITLKPQSMAPEVVGFGRVTPKVVWQAVAEVTGKVVYKNPALEKGRIMEAGIVLLRIDPLDYELKLAQAEADVKASLAELAKLAQEEQNLQESMKIENNRLHISQKEVQRKQQLRANGLISQSDLDIEQQALLAQKKLVQELDNQAALLPDEKRVTQAQLKVNQSKVAEAQRALEKTEIVLPFDARVAGISVEQDQVVNLQQVMVTAHGLRTMEVNAQVAIHDMQALKNSLNGDGRGLHGKARAEQADFHAFIRLASGRYQMQWRARVSRISETVEPNQGTVGVILEVEQDYRTLTSSSRPPLLNGMFVEARLQGHDQLHWLIPERALHGSHIYLVKQEQLYLQPVRVLYRRDGLVAVEGELAENDWLILNDIIPAIPGMGVHALTVDGQTVVRQPVEEEGV